MPEVKTHFAPPEQAPHEHLRESSQAVIRWPFVRDVLDAVPGPAIVLNMHRQIIAANRRFLDMLAVDSLEDVLGLRPGEALDCRHVPSAPSGCGTSKACRYCEFVKTLLEALNKENLAVGECRLLTRAGDAIDLEMAVTRHDFDGVSVLFVGMRDIGAEKRRDVLERTFFHDVLNTINGIHGLLHLMSWDAKSPDRTSVSRVIKLVNELIEEIYSQRQLLAAEKNELSLRIQGFALHELLTCVADAYQSQPLGKGKAIILHDMEPIAMHSDPTLLTRVVGNLIKNALEATEPGDCIEVEARSEGGEAVIGVSNGAVMNESTRAQVFQRSFSTKGSGRGVGLYSVQLFTERYLGGCVAFTSTPEEGTRFEVRVPLRLGPDGEPGVASVGESC